MERAISQSVLRCSIRQGTTVAPSARYYASKAKAAGPSSNTKPPPPRPSLRPRPGGSSLPGSPRAPSPLATAPDASSQKSREKDFGSFTKLGEEEYHPWIFVGWQQMYRQARDFDYDKSRFRSVPKWWFGVMAFGMVGMWTAAFMAPESLKADLRRQRLGIEDSEVFGPRRWNPLHVLRSVIANSPSQVEAGAEGVEGSIPADGKHKLITIRIPQVYLANVDRDKDPVFATNRLTISSISIKQPDIQIQRSYTPLQAPIDAKAAGQTDLLVKRYDDGEMGRYLHFKRPGQDQIEARGWETTWDEKWMASAKDGPIEELVFIAGGTGVAPAFQLINSALKRNSNPGADGKTAAPKFRLLYASQSPESFLLLPELKALQDAHPDRLEVGLWSEQDGAQTSDKSNAPGFGFLGSMIGMQQRQREIGGLSAVSGRITPEDLSKCLGNNEEHKRRAILVCGPDGMVEAIAGPRAPNGREQGVLGGALSQVEGVDAGQVWKL